MPTWIAIQIKTPATLKAKIWVSRIKLMSRIFSVAERLLRSVGELSNNIFMKTELLQLAK